MTEVQAYVRYRNGQEEQVRAHDRNAPGFSEKSATAYRSVKSVDAVAAAKARLAAKGIIV